MIEEKMSVSEVPTIPEWYRGSRVLITGGSGFMGKVLVEKLLRSCPDLDTVYLLLRPKKGKPASERIQDIIDVPLFDRLREENPTAFTKLVAVAGDVTQLGLGLSDEDRRLLQQQVHVVFHSAASVRFDDPLRDAILINVRGTREVIDLALGMENLKVFLHISTAYCNRDSPEVLEKLYPAPGDWRAMIQLVEEVGKDDGVLRCLTPKILADSPNTYTYAKALSEQVVNDHKELIPVVIVRPSIVVSTVAEPVPGWIDNYNGPSGLMAGGGTGLVRIVYGDQENIADHVPVDKAIKSIIFIAWHRALLSSPNLLPIYNCASLIAPVTQKEVIDLGIDMMPELRLGKMLWYPNFTMTRCRWEYVIKVILFHMLPAMLIDIVLKLGGRQPFLEKLQRRIFISNMALKYFIFHNFYFSNANFLDLQTSHMKSDDVKDFGYNDCVTDHPHTLRLFADGARKYLLKEPAVPPAEAKAYVWRMYWLDVVTKSTLLLTLFWVCGGFNLLHGTALTMQEMMS